MSENQHNETPTPRTDAIAANESASLRQLASTLERECAELRRELDAEKKKRGPGPACEKHPHCPMEFFGYLSPCDDSGVPGEDWRCVLCAFDSLDDVCSKLHEARGQVEGVINGLPADCKIHVREGTGPENIYATLAVSVLKLMDTRDAALSRERRLRSAIEPEVEDLRRISQSLFLVHGGEMLSAKLSGLAGRFEAALAFDGKEGA